VPRVSLLRTCVVTFWFVFARRNNAKRKKGGENGKMASNKKRFRPSSHGDPYHCDYCRRDLSTSLRIKCNECSNFDLCLECFSVGAEITPHKNTHSYRVIDSLSVPVYTIDWGADEETLLLEGIERFGLHWMQVANHVGRSAEECMTHYFKVYVETDCFPKPKKLDDMPSGDVKQMIEDKRLAGARRIAAQKSGVKLPVVVKEEEKGSRRYGSSGRGSRQGRRSGW
jgi:transcriptional adapter 2-alpha